MSNDIYQKALLMLDEEDRDRVIHQLAEWEGEDPSEDMDVAQIARNIKAETALTDACFADLLRSFVTHLDGMGEAVTAWEKACDNYSFRGAALKTGLRPQTVGRAMKLDDYADRMEKQFSVKTLRHALIKNAGKATPLSSLSRKMEKASLGGKIIWACFSQASPANPFDGLKNESHTICTALGLGMADIGGRFLLFSYDSESHSNLPLHRPTTADAGSYFYFRPHPDPNAEWGMTHPLENNPDNVDGRPELIHKQITGASLLFPYKLTTT